MNQPVTRRTFLQTVIAGTAGTRLEVKGAPAAASGGDEPTDSVVDSHTHFYDPSRPQGIPWPPNDDQLLYRQVLPKHYRALPQPLAVTGTVVVEASARVEDNQWILDLAANDPFIAGFVGNLPVGQPDFREHLKRFAANRLFRGLRISGDRLRSGLKDDRFVADLKFLTANDLTLDLLGGPPELPDAARLARELPRLRLVIDHVAQARVDGKSVEPDWRCALASVAQSPNVFCKVSGLVEGTGRSDGTAPRDVDFYRPVLDAVWDLFGEDRLVYGSNWPVSERFADLATVQSLVRDYFSAKGTIALQKVFGRNAQRLYRWVRRP